jgi:hypothetical protein
MFSLLFPVPVVILSALRASELGYSIKEIGVGFGPVYTLSHLIHGAFKRDADQFRGDFHRRKWPTRAAFVFGLLDFAVYYASYAAMLVSPYLGAVLGRWLFS